MSFSRDTILRSGMMLVRLSGAKTLRDTSACQLLAKCVASSPLAEGRWVVATAVGYPSLIRTQQVEAVKHHTSFSFSAAGLMGLLMDLNVTQAGLCHPLEFVPRRAIGYTAATSHILP